MKLLIFLRDHLAIFARWKTFAPLHAILAKLVVPGHKRYQRNYRDGPEKFEPPFAVTQGHWNPSIGYLRLNSYQWPTKSSGLSRTVSEKNTDFGWKSQFFSPSVHLSPILGDSSWNFVTALVLKKLECSYHCAIMRQNPSRGLTCNACLRQN